MIEQGEIPVGRIGARLIGSKRQIRARLEKITRGDSNGDQR
jgi:hypothetical protein